MIKEVARSSITGKFVTKEYAEENPDTTVVETIEDQEALITLIKEFMEQVNIILN